MPYAYNDFNAEPVSDIKFIEFDQIPHPQMKFSQTFGANSDIYS